MSDEKREFPCECCDTDEQHDAWEKEEAMYWRAYFGITSKMTKAERVNQLEAFRPLGNDSKLGDE